MSALTAALSTEWLKFRHSRLPILTTAALVLAIPILAPLNVTVDGNIDSIAEATWTDFFTAGAATTASGGLLAFGLVVAWLYGREFTEGTITGLFALPTSRPVLATAKLLLYSAWAIGTSAALTFSLIGVGLFFDLGAFDMESVARQLLVSIGTACLVVPCAWVATMTRGYFAPIGTIVGLAVLARIAVSTPVADWVPVASPGLWAASRASLNESALILQAGIVLLFALAFSVITINYWGKLRLS